MSRLLDSIDEEDLFDYPAVELFVDRAASLNQSSRWTSSNAALVGRICSRLDGLPLALEIAAGDAADSAAARSGRFAGRTLRATLR
jgi:predicted ATPase